jgi:hypothetical protein
MGSLGRKAMVSVLSCLFISSFIFNSSIGISQTLKILAMGNSITWGTNVSPDPNAGINTSYRYKLYQLLTQSGYSFDFIGGRSSGYNVFPDAQHCGIPGITDDHLATILETGYNPNPAYNYYETAGPYLNYYPADIILLEIGTNDVMVGDVYDISGEVNRIFNAIDAYETSSGKPVLVFVGKLISTQTGSGSCTEDALINTYNANLTSIVNSRISGGDKLVMVDLQCGAGIDYSADMLDTYHPNPTGYQKIGQTWFNSIDSYNSAPVIDDIPNQTKAEGTAFTAINLDIYVSDNETSDANITWSYTPASPQYLNISITNRIATITPKDINWNGSETITFVANDNGYVVAGLRKFDSDPATFTVTAVNDPPVILSQAVSLSVNEDNYIDLVLSNLTVQDVDNTLAQLTLITQSGTNYTFSGNRIYPAHNYFGNIKVNVVVSDGQSLSNVFQVSVDVISVNDPPSIILPVNRTAFENILYSETFQVQDVDAGDVVTLTPVTKPSWLNYSSSTLTLYGTPGSADIGNHLVTMRASDGKLSVDSSLIITVNNVNHPPVITSTPETNADDYRLYSYRIVATDPDNDEVTFTPLTLPSWAEFNAGTGLLSGTPRYYDTGTFEVSIKASDEYEDTIQSFSIIVANTNDKPFFVSQPDTLIRENDQYSYSIDDVDEDDELTVSVVTIPSWLTYFDQAGMIIGRPGESDLGKALVALEVSDGKAVTEQIFYITVVSYSGVRDNNQNVNIVVYPNPAQTCFSILSPQGNLESVQLFDIKGISVYYRTLSPGCKELHINDHSLLPGIYFYRIVTASAPVCGKIILK